MSTTSAANRARTCDSRRPSTAIVRSTPSGCRSGPGRSQSGDAPRGACQLLDDDRRPAGPSTAGRRRAGRRRGHRRRLHRPVDGDPPARDRPGTACHRPGDGSCRLRRVGPQRRLLRRVSDPRTRQRPAPLSRRDRGARARRGLEPAGPRRVRARSRARLRARGDGGADPRRPPGPGGRASCTRRAHGVVRGASRPPRPRGRARGGPLPALGGWAVDGRCCRDAQPGKACLGTRAGGGHDGRGAPRADPGDGRRARRRRRPGPGHGPRRRDGERTGPPRRRGHLGILRLAVASTTTSWCPIR
jgi:hypothetical protein